MCSLTMLRCVALAVMALAMQASGQSCTSDTCLNSGVCILVLGNPSCACPLGFNGDRCENAPLALDPCRNTPCLNGGVCVPDGDIFTCTCGSGFAGGVCQAIATTAAPTIPTTPADPCKNTPCLNGGVCVPVGDIFTCSCNSAFAGSVCQVAATTTVAPTTPIDPCRNAPCLNGGVCAPDGVILFTCSCPGGFEGSLCQTANPACVTSPCFNGGICKSLTTTTFECVCPAGTVAPLCLPGDAATTASVTVAGPPPTCTPTAFNGCIKADVIFVFTENVYDTRNYDYIKEEYFPKFIDFFGADVRVGVVVYQANVTEVINLDEFEGDKSGLKTRVNAIARDTSTGNPIFSKALDYVKDVAFQKARPDAQKVVISVVHTLPDVNDYANILQTAGELKADCTQIYIDALARRNEEFDRYGSEPYSLLQQVASATVKPYYTNWSSFSPSSQKDGFLNNCNNYIPIIGR